MLWRFSDGNGVKRADYHRKAAPEEPRGPNSLCAQPPIEVAFQATQFHGYRASCRTLGSLLGGEYGNRSVNWDVRGGKTSSGTIAVFAGLAALSGCISGVVTSLAERPATEPARIEGDSWRPLFLGDEQVYVRFVDGDDLGVFSTAVLVDPGPHCVIGEIIRTGVFNSDDGWTEPLCFDAAAGRTYRIRYHLRGYQMIDRENRTVMAEGSWTNQLDPATPPTSN